MIVKFYNFGSSLSLSPVQTDTHTRETPFTLPSVTPHRPSRMPDIFVLTEEVREKIEQWRADNMTGDEIVTMLKLAYPSAFSGITFATAYELDQLIFGEGAGGGYIRAEYNYPMPGGIYTRDTDHGMEVYRCVFASCGYFTFDKDVILQPEMVAWVRDRPLTYLADLEGFRQSFMQTFFPSGRVDSDALRWVDIIARGVGYDYPRAVYPGDVGSWQYRRADDEPFFYRVTSAGAMTCSVEFLSAGNVRNWGADLWYAYLRAESPDAGEPSSAIQSAIAMVTRTPVRADPPEIPASAPDTVAVPSN